MKLGSKKAVEAKRVGTSLIAAFHKANPPLVWRFDLERNHSFSLALQGNESDWQLGLTVPSGEFQTVAHFAERKDAEQAFTETEKVLAQSKLTAWSWIVRVISVIVFSFIGFLIFGFLVQQNIIPKTRPYTATAVPTPNMKPTAKPGVPLPADEFLTPPSP